MGRRERGQAASRRVVERVIQAAAGSSGSPIRSVCAGDYAPFFEQAISVIDIACEEFEPVG